MTGGVFPPACLSTARLELRQFRPGDAEDVHAVWNDETYMRFAPAGFPHAGAGIEQAAMWCEAGAEEERSKGRGINFACTRRGHGRLLGQVSLFGTDWTAMVTEIHYWTVPWERGNGYATEAARAVGRWALLEQGFARITLHAVAPNVPSQAVARAAGFRFEGILRNAAMTRTDRADLAVYSLVPEDLD